jgi:hypothetical protein
MNPENANRASGAAVGLIVGSVLFIGLAAAVRFLTVAPDIDADAGEKRAETLAKIRATETTTLNQVAWVDESRGIVRLPIDTAIQIALQAWQDPAQARADLIAREKRATAPAPVAPAKPSAFE